MLVYIVVLSGCYSDEYYIVCLDDDGHTKLLRSSGCSMKILYIVNSSTFFRSHFLHLAQSMKNAGNTVYVAVGDEKFREEIEGHGLLFINHGMSRTGRNVFQELLTVLSLLKVMFKVKPDLMHLFTIKPVIYGLILARFFPKIINGKIIVSITGLGSMSLNDSFYGRLLWRAIFKTYKYLLYKCEHSVVFENSDDRSLFLDSNIILESNSFIVNGAGVDISKFTPSRFKSDRITIVMVARLLKDKGVQEFLDAAEIIYKKKTSRRLSACR